MPSQVFGRTAGHLRRSVGDVSVINARPVGFKPLRDAPANVLRTGAVGIRDPCGTIPHTWRPGGVVGALTNTFDSATLIDTYMPDMQTALDRIGRVLFLFYWKPEDFATAFGADDQTQLENKLVSNFKSFGDLVMDLLQKNKQNEQGSVGLT